MHDETLKPRGLTTMLKQFSILGLLAVMFLVSTPNAAVAGGRRANPRRHAAPQPVMPAEPVYEGAEDANGHGYWASPAQSSSQEAITNAVATGDHSTATSNVNQFNYQSRYGNQGMSGNQYGYWAVPSIQISVQQGTANAVATGNNATAASHLHQVNHQEYWNTPNDWTGYDYGVDGGDPQAQVSNQRAEGNAIATGDYSNATSNIDQTSYQEYPFYPDYFDYGYDYEY
jgi:hypothetical protein